MQANRQAWLPEGLWPGQAGSANVLFHHKPVRAAMCTVVVGNDHNNLSWMKKSLDQFSVSNGVRDDDTTTIVTTDDTLLGFAANHRVAANYFPHSPAASPPSIQWHQSYCDQQSSASYSAPFESFCGRLEIVGQSGRHKTKKQVPGNPQPCPLKL